MLKSLFLFLFLTNLSLAGVVNVAVAANVSYAIKDIKEAFSKIYPHIKIKIILGSSGKLTAQISNGAPYDVFMSANMKYPLALYKNGLAVSEPYIYAKGGLSLLSNKPQAFKKGMELLRDVKIKRIAIANPETAPYGKAAFEALRKAVLLDALKAKFVYGESISQTLSYTIQATDIGIVASSLLYTPKMKRFQRGVHYEEVEPSLYTPIEQGIVLLKKAKKNEDAEAFYRFVLGEKAREIFQRYGYKVL